MAQLTRKQREIREREDRFLDEGRSLLLDRGYAGLTMDRLAEATEYSKGTVYQHFANKEDLVVGVLARSCARRQALFERASAFRGRPRDRMAAIGIAAEIFRALHPDAEVVEHLCRTSAIRDNASEKRLQQLERVEQATISVCHGITRDGIAHGDLDLPDNSSVADIVLGLWSMYIGTFAIIDGVPLDQLGFENPMETLRSNAQRFLDAWNWRPLSCETELDDQRDRILREAFHEEARQLGLT